MRIEQIHRLLRVVPRTRTGTYRVTIGTLAEKLGVSRNTIKDDIVLLELFNAPIVYDAARRTLYYREPFELRPPLWLKSDEVLALLVATRLAALSRMLPVGRTLVRALERIAPMLAGSASFGPDLLGPVVSTPDAPVSEVEARHFTLLCEAITQRREVRIIYQKARKDPAPETRVVHPLHWFIRPDACLLILHEPVLNERRNFELARIRQVEFTGSTFTWPRGFELRKHLAGGFGRFIGEPVHAVRVVFDREYVPLVREQPWQSDQRLVERADGSAEATYQVCHTADLEQSILRAGGQVEVVSPPEVRARIQAAAARILGRHQ
jgi:proteasome accessory factor B